MTGSKGGKRMMSILLSLLKRPQEDQQEDHHHKANIVMRVRRSAIWKREEDLAPRDLDDQYYLDQVILLQQLRLLVQRTDLRHLGDDLDETLTIQTVTTILNTHLHPVVQNPTMAVSRPDFSLVWG